jgi:hypothetical protein
VDVAWLQGWHCGNRWSENAFGGGGGSGSALLQDHEILLSEQCGVLITPQSGNRS